MGDNDTVLTCTLAYGEKWDGGHCQHVKYLRIRSISVIVISSHR